jgi:hypothetical protein
MRRIAELLIGPFIALAAAQAQQLRGVVRDSTSARPIPGVVILLLGSDSTTIGRNITNERGEYRIALTPAMTRARFLRLGFRPREFPIPAAVNGVASLDLSMETIPALLETVHVRANASCPRRSDDAQAFALLEQSRAALLASVVSREANRASMVRYVFDRFHDGTSDKVVRMTVQADSADSTSASFIAAHSAHDFARKGFVEEGPRGVVYNAPDAEVLLDTAFSSAYCFRVLTDRKRPMQVGLGFTVARGEKNRIDVDGALWVDTSARALTDIEFLYKGMDSRVDRLKPGGTISFHEMKNGAVIIDSWALRLVGATVDTVVTGRSGIVMPRQRLNLFVHEHGGEVAHARWLDGTRWDASLATLQATARTRSGLPAAHVELSFPGTPYDAVSDGDGRIEIHDLVPGPYSGVTVDSALMALGLAIPTDVEFDADRGATITKPFVANTLLEYAIGRCESATRKRYTSADSSAVLARVLDSALRPAADVRWWAWRPVQATDNPSDAQNGWIRIRDDRTEADGTIQFCGIAPGTTIDVRGQRDSGTFDVLHGLQARVAIMPIRLAMATATSVDMSMPPPPIAAGFAGFVLADSTQQPIAGAEVSLPALGKSVLSDEKGQFHFTDIPPGEQRVQVRRFGYGLADTRLQFVAGQTVVRRFMLMRAVMLQAVDASAEAMRVQSFDEHKRTGLGHFMERAEIARYDGTTMASVLQNITGADVVNTGIAAYVLSRRAPPGVALYKASKFERQSGMPAAACYALVYLDGVLMNGPKEPTEPFDVNQVSPDQVEAIEFYAGTAETPFEYSRMASSCGVLVIWTSLKKK